MTSPTIGQRICQVFSELNKPGSFSCFEVLDPCPNPALCIDGLGTIGLPLSIRDAKAISESPAARESPFGKGSETLIDTSVRKSWQVDPEHFEIRNPKFQSQLDRIVRKTAVELGVACGGENVAAQLYKLLLYEEGAFFLPHQDSEKAERMFGTLAICLPSKHSGGDIHLTHDGQHRVFRSSTTSEVDYSYAAWYADVTHEVKPVTSGNRLVLIYNLVQTNDAMMTLASTISNSNSRLKAVMSQWNVACSSGNAEFPRFLVYKLSHQYTEAGLSFNSLKGSDVTTIQHLENASKDEDFILYLAHAQKEVTGSCDESEYYYGRGRYGGHHAFSECTDSDDEDSSASARSNPISVGDCHEIDEVIDSSLKLTRIIDQSGKVIAEDVDLHVEDIAQGDIFRRAPDDEDYSGYTGNEGVSTTHFYHDTVVVLIPRSGMVDFMLRSAREDSSHVMEWIKRLQAELEDASKQSSREQLDRLCTLIIQHNRDIRLENRTIFTRIFNCRAPFSDSVISQTAIAALQLGDVLLFEEAVAEIKSKPSSDLFEAVRASTPLGFGSLIPGTTKALQVMKHISEKWSALLCIGGSCFSESADSNEPGDQVMKDWIREQVNASLEAPEFPDAKDGTVLAEIGEKYGFDMLIKRIIPLINKNLYETPFALAFASRLFDLRGSDRLSNATLEGVYSEVLLAALEGFDLMITPEPSKPRYYPYSTLYQPQMRVEQSEQAPAIPGEFLVQILQQCTALSLESHVAMLFQKIHESAMTIPTIGFERVIIPYISNLLVHLNKTNSSTILNQDTGLHVLQLLQQYILRYVAQEPRPSTSWTRPTGFIVCACIDCNTLRTFVADPIRKEGRFSMAAKRRKHLELHLFSREGYTQNTVRQGSPHTLVITKTDAGFRREHTEWKSRSLTARRTMLDLAEINPRLLKQLLGAKYDEIMKAKLTDQETACPGPKQPLGPSPNPRATAAKNNHSSKRKSDQMDAHPAALENKKPRQEEVIDLTAD